MPKHKTPGTTMRKSPERSAKGEWNRQTEPINPNPLNIIQKVLTYVNIKQIVYSMYNYYFLPDGSNSAKNARTA